MVKICFRVLTPVFSEHLTDAVHEAISAGLTSEGVLHGAGMRSRKPQTKASLMLCARQVVVFKASGVLRERVNEGSGA